MKRTFLLLLAAVLLMSFAFAGTAFAAGEDAVFTISEVTGAPGDTVDVKVTLQSSQAINSIALKSITFDESKLEFVGFTELETIKGKSMMWVDGTNDDIVNKTIVAPLKAAEKYSGDFCTLRFKIKDSVTEDCEVEISASSIVKNNATTYTSGVVSGKVNVSTYVATTGITLDKTSATVNKGTSAALVATVLPSNATNKNVVWTSDDASVATVSAGTVTAVGAGETTIKATTEDGGFVAICKVKVVVPVASVSLDETELTIEEGYSETVKAAVLPADATNKKVIWSSSDESVATVNEKGKITAVSIGEAVITATTEDGAKTAECKVTVIEPLPVMATFTFDKSEGRPGDTIKVSVSLESLTEIDSIALTDIEFDEDVFEFVGFADYEHLGDKTVMPIENFVDTAKRTIMAPLSAAEVYNGEFCSIELKIKEDAPEGFFEVSGEAVTKKKSVEYKSVVTPSEITVRYQITGDVDGNEGVDIDDAVRLFQYSMLPDLYPVDYIGSMDFTKDGVVDIDDAVRLFQYSMLPDLYPIG